jgi:hypothetical protein
LIEFPLATLFILVSDPTFFMELSNSEENCIEFIDTPLATLFMLPIDVTLLMEESTISFECSNVDPFEEDERLESEPFSTDDVIVCTSAVRSSC